MKWFKDANGNSKWTDIIAIVISIIALAISIFSWKVSRRQLEITEKEKSPILRFEYLEDNYLPGDEAYYKNDELPENERFLTIYNDGSKISDLSISVAEIIEVINKKNNTLIDVGSDKKHWDENLRVGAEFTGVGRLGLLRGKNIKPYLYARTLEKLGDDFLSMELNRFDIVRLTYKNSIGEKKVEYHKIGDTHYGESDETLFNRYYNSTKIITIENTPLETISKWKSKLK